MRRKSHSVAQSEQISEQASAYGCRNRPGDQLVGGRAGRGNRGGGERGHRVAGRAGTPELIQHFFPSDMLPAVLKAAGRLRELGRRRDVLDEGEETTRTRGSGGTARARRAASPAGAPGFRDAVAGREAGVRSDFWKLATCS